MPVRLNKAVLNKLQYAVQGYFRAYYRELRKQLAEHPEAELPCWFENGRRIETRVCLVVGNQAEHTVGSNADTNAQ